MGIVAIGRSVGKTICTGRAAGTAVLRDLVGGSDLFYCKADRSDASRPFNTDAAVTVIATTPKNSAQNPCNSPPSASLVQVLQAG